MLRFVGYSSCSRPTKKNKISVCHWLLVLNFFFLPMQRCLRRRSQVRRLFLPHNFVRFQLLHSVFVWQRRAWRRWTRCACPICFKHQSSVQYCSWILQLTPHSNCTMNRNKENGDWSFQTRIAHIEEATSDRRRIQRAESAVPPQRVPKVTSHCSVWTGWNFVR